MFKKNLFWLVFLLSLFLISCNDDKPTKPSESEPTKVSTPSFNPPAGVYSDSLVVEITCATPGAEIYYRFDYFKPIDVSQLYVSPLHISETTSIYVKAYKEDYQASESKIRTFTIGDDPYPSMAFVPGGSFTMGRTRGDGFLCELPLHEVTVDPFYIAKYEVTQAEYKWVMGNNPSYYYWYADDNNPVESVTWFKAVEYCNLRSIQEGLTPCYDTSEWTCDFAANGYRLPTEAEWEYAARGASNNPDYLYSGSDDVDSVAVYWGVNEEHETKPIGSKLPNKLGIYDMSGNVFEWCYDWYADYSNEAQLNPTGPNTGSKRVVRGGCWGNSQTYCRLSNRSSFVPSLNPFDDHYFGFRLVRSGN